MKETANYRAPDPRTSTHPKHAETREDRGMRGCRNVSSQRWVLVVSLALLLSNMTNRSSPKSIQTPLPSDRPSLVFRPTSLFWGPRCDANKALRSLQSSRVSVSQLHASGSSSTNQSEYQSIRVRCQPSQFLHHPVQLHLSLHTGSFGLVPARLPSSVNPFCTSMLVRLGLGTFNLCVIQFKCRVIVCQSVCVSVSLFC